MRPITPSSVAAKEVQPIYQRPMRLAEILDRSLRLSVTLFKQLWVLFGIMAALEVAKQLPQLKAYPVAVLVILVSAFLLSWYLLILGPIMAVEHWTGNPVTRKQVEHKVTFKMALKFIDVGLRVMLVCFLGLLLFIIPGLVMMVRRSLALYVLLIEEVSPKEAIAKSVHLMSQTKWNALDGPMMRVSGITLLLWALTILVAAIAGGAVFASATSQIGVLATALLLFTSAWLGHFVSCFAYFCYAGLYCDLMARYEGADLTHGLEQFAKSAHSTTATLPGSTASGSTGLEPAPPA